MQVEVFTAYKRFGYARIGVGRKQTAGKQRGKKNKGYKFNLRFEFDKTVEII